MAMNSLQDMVKAACTVARRSIGIIACSALALLVVAAPADDDIAEQASWEVPDLDSVSKTLREGLLEIGVESTEIDLASQNFLSAIDEQQLDSLDAFVAEITRHAPAVEELARAASVDSVAAAQSVDPSADGYAQIENLPSSIRNSVRTWLGRLLIRERLFDEALPIIAEVDPVYSIDPASALFFRGTCYHALLMKKEALADLRRLLEHDEQVPARYSRTAKLMVADIKPLQEDSLDEISRLMNDVTRRLDLGRSDEDVEEREQKIIDKLSKLIDKLEQQQQQQQQQQQSSQQQQQGGQQQSGQSSPMDDSRIAGANGDGNVDRKRFDDEDSWGNLPEAERKQALQQISRDLPTHYRDAIEAYFRKIATD